MVCFLVLFLSVIGKPHSQAWSASLLPLVFQSLDELFTGNLGGNYGIAEWLNLKDILVGNVAALQVSAHAAGVHNTDLNVFAYLLAHGVALAICDEVVEGGFHAAVGARLCAFIRATEQVLLHVAGGLRAFHLGFLLCLLNDSCNLGVRLNSGSIRSVVLAELDVGYLLGGLVKGDVCL